MLRGEAAAARSRGHWAALLGGLAALVACVPRPSEPRCRAMAAHVVELERGHHEGRAAELAASVASDHREVLVSTCLDAGTVAEVECVLQVDTLDQLSRCAPR